MRMDAVASKLRNRIHQKCMVYTFGGWQRTKKQKPPKKSFPPIFCGKWNFFQYVCLKRDVPSRKTPFSRSQGPWEFGAVAVRARSVSVDTSWTRFKPEPGWSLTLGVFLTVSEWLNLFYPRTEAACFALISLLERLLLLPLEFQINIS